MAEQEKNNERVSLRAQLEYPLDAQSEAIFKSSEKKFLPEMNLIQAITIPTGATTFELRNSDVMKVTGAAAVTIATITGGYNGQVLKLIFTDGNVTITDTAAATMNTVNLSAAFTSSANDVLTLVRDDNKWFELARSVN